MEDRKSAPESLALRDHAAKCLQLADTLPPGEDAEQMRRLALAYVQLADRIDQGIATAGVARWRRMDEIKDQGA